MPINRYVQNLIAGIALALSGVLSPLAHGQVPLAPVPEYLPRHDQLEHRREKLSAQRVRLQALMEEHNRKRVPSGTPAAEQLRLEGNQLREMMRQHLEESKAFNASVISATANTLPPTASDAERQELLTKLRQSVACLQSILRRLQQSEELDAASRAEWEQASADAADEAWERGVDMLSTRLGKLADKQFEKILLGKRGEMDQALDQLINETEPQRKHELMLAQEQLKKEIVRIEKARAGFSKTVEQVREASGKIDAAQKQDPDAAETNLEIAYAQIEKALGEPEVQAVLQTGESFGSFATYAKSIVDSGYDIAVESVAIRRISALNRNSEKYLKAVKILDERMKTTVEKIQLAERQLTTAP